MPYDIHFEHDLAAPPAQVFQAMTDFAAWPHRIKGFVRVEPLTDGAFGVGTKWREVRKMFGRETAEVFEVQACEPNTSLVLFVDGKQGDSGSGEFHYRYALAPTATGTRLSTDVHVVTGSAFMDFMAKLMSGVCKKMIRADLDALQTYLKNAADPLATRDSA